MIQIGDETLNDNSGSAVFNGTNLTKIVFNGTTVWQKGQTGLIGANIQYEDIKYNSSTGKIEITINYIGWSTTSDNAFDVSGIFTADIEAWASVLISGTTNYTVYHGRQNVSINLSPISVPANQTAFACLFAPVTFEVDVDDTYQSISIRNVVEDNLETVFLKRDGIETMVTPWHIGLGFNY